MIALLLLVRAFMCQGVGFPTRPSTNEVPFNHHLPLMLGEVGDLVFIPLTLIPYVTSMVCIKAQSHLAAKMFGRPTKGEDG